VGVGSRQLVQQFRGLGICFSPLDALPIAGDEGIAVLAHQLPGVFLKGFGEGLGIEIEALEAASLLDDIARGGGVELPGAGDDQGEEDAVKRPDGVEKGASHVVVLLEILGGEDLSEQVEPEERDDDRADDADEDELEGIEVNDQGVLQRHGNGFFHGMSKALIIS